MKSVGSNVRGGNLALIIGGIVTILFGVASILPIGPVSTSLTVNGGLVPGWAIIILGFVLILLALRSNVSRAVTKTGS